MSETAKRDALIQFRTSSTVKVGLERLASLFGQTLGSFLHDMAAEKVGKLGHLVDRRGQERDSSA